MAVGMEPSSSALADLVASLHTVFGDDLHAVVLFGTAAEDRQRASSDTNLVVVLERFSSEAAAGAAAAMGAERVALRARFLVLCRVELADAAQTFSVKFSDILRRRRVLYGPDPFIGIAVPRAAAIAQLQQALFNLALRLRERILSVEDSRRRTAVIAENAGGVRACAAELLALEGCPASDPRAALITIAGDPLTGVSAAREGTLSPADVGRVLCQLLGVVETMRARARILS
jgi:predicted nucleotidyltransferase